MMASLFTMSSISTILFVLLASTFVQSQSPKECDLSSSNEIINVENYRFQYLNVLNLNENAKWKYTACTWKISKHVANSALDFNRIVLQPEDNLKVESIIKNKTELIYSSNGTIVPGILSLASVPEADITITLTLSNSSKTKFDRTFVAVYYVDSAQYRLTKDSGLYSFPLNTATNATIPFNFNFELHPDNQYSDRKIMLTFYKFPKTYSFTMDNVTYSENKIRPPTFYLSKSNSISFSLNDYTLSKNYDDNIHFQYWLVSASCSQSLALEVNKPVSILVPDESFRKAQQLSAIQCLQIYTRPVNTTFQLSLNNGDQSLANAGDLISVYEDGHLKMSIPSDANPFLKSPQNNYFYANQLLIIYDSPYLMNTNSKFVAPTLSAILQGGSYVLQPDSKPLSLDVNLSAKDSTKVVHIVNVNQTGHSVIVQFDDSAKIQPGKVTIKIFDSVIDTENPVAVLGKFSYLPSTIPCDSSVMRVEFSGSELKQPLKVTYKAVDNSKSCNLISTVNPNFKVENDTAQQVCTWYIPETKSKYSMINPTFVDLPKGSNLTVTKFTSDSKVPTTYTGPINKFNLPDVALDGSSSYEFLLNTNNDVLKDVKLLISKKPDYLVDSVKIMNSSDVYSLQSTNYPGNYPIGLNQNWAFTAGEAALVTFQDIHLADLHQLSISAEQVNKSWSGNVDLNKVSDYFVSAPFIFTLDAMKYKLDSFSNRGFNLTVNYAGHGGLIDVSKHPTFGLNSTSDSYSNHRCIWIVDGDVKGKDFSDIVLRINVTLGDSVEKTKANLTVFDSISLREPREAKINATYGNETLLYLSSVRSIIIVYDYSASISTKTNYSVYFNVVSEKCKNSYPNVPKKCNSTDRCITDWIACNGVNDCGDWSDERFCNSSAPIPPPIIQGGGVNVWVVILILMPLSAILSIIGYIYIPDLLARIRRGRYSEFRNFSEVN